jgi:hypothetical protein
MIESTIFVRIVEKLKSMYAITPEWNFGYWE